MPLATAWRNLLASEEFGKGLNQVPEGIEVHQATALTDGDLEPAHTLNDQQLNKRPEFGQSIAVL